ncbi:uncharacterized protein [Scyliorhinus torazame]|uniref:uncharacterized protein n=1 Tax=Scyliorhinus torazame TaxID=75743 RepID=UPI003B5C18BB
MAAETGMMRDEQNRLMEKMVDLENRSRRQNVRILGLPEAIEGSDAGRILRRGWRSCLGKVIKAPSGPFRGILRADTIMADPSKFAILTTAEPLPTGPMVDMSNLGAMDHSKEPKSLHDMHLKTLSDIFDTMKPDPSQGKPGLTEAELQELLTKGEQKMKGMDCVTRLYQAEAALKALLEYHLERELEGCDGKGAPAGAGAGAGQSSDIKKLQHALAEAEAKLKAKEQECHDSLQDIADLKAQLKKELEDLRQDFVTTCQQLQALQAGFSSFAKRLNR